MDFDLRVVATTSRELQGVVDQGMFRQDLLFRLNAVKISLPPLRERGEDISLLAQHFLNLYGKKLGKKVTGFTPEALEILTQYRWPGNVRELRNVVRRGIAMASAPRFGVDLLPDTLVSLLGNEHSDCPEIGFFQLRARRIATFEQEYLARELDAHRGDVTAAAKTARIPRGTYYRLMKNHGIKASDYRKARNSE